jgi:hypothetical protein
MIIKERVYDECSKCGKRELLSEEQYGCDICKKPIHLREPTTYLEIVVFVQRGDTTHYQLCSWECALKMIKKGKSDYFIQLPTLHCDDTRPGRKEFFAAIKSFQKQGGK